MANTPQAPLPSEPTFIGDDEVCVMIGCKPATLRRWLSEGPLPGSVDLRKAEPIMLGASRRWNKAKLLALLNA